MNAKEYLGYVSNKTHNFEAYKVDMKNKRNRYYKIILIKFII